MTTRQVIGAAADQCPTNGMLGGMAYQDPENVGIRGGIVANASLNQSKYRQAPDQSGTGAIVLDYTKGDLFKVTATGAVQIILSGMPSGYVGTLILDATNFGAYTITWPTGTKWPGGTAPTMTTSGTDRVEFIVNAAGVIYASIIGKDFK